MVKRGDERVFAASMQAAICLLCFVATYIELCDAAAVVDVYRMIQYDFRGAQFGSRRATLNHHATSGFSVPGSDLSRSVVMLPISKANVTILNNNLQSKQLLGGLLFLLPRDFGGRTGEHVSGQDGKEADDDQSSSVGALEQWLIHNSIPYPVYFAFDEDKLAAVLKDVQSNDASGRPATATTGGYKLVVPVAEAKKLPPTVFTNIQGWLWGMRSDGDSTVLPTIAIVASYDTFGAAPALGTGSDSNGSGVVALLELARLFARLYANPRTRGGFNLVFGLTSGGPYNYNGTARWLRGFDQRIRESIDYALCLNSIGSVSDKLWLHVSKPPENAFIKQIYNDLTSVAQDLGVAIDVKHKKINISDSRVAWEHEQFSRHRITAATLSELIMAPELLEHVGGIADRRSIVNDSVVVRNIKIIAESLARHIYRREGKQIEVFEDGSSLAISSSYVRLWMDLLSQTPRVTPYMGKSAPIIHALHKELSEHTNDASLQHDTLDNTFLFYDTINAQLSIYQVASVTFDLYILLAVASYLGFLFIVLLVATKGLEDLLGIFRRPPSRKLKAT